MRGHALDGIYHLVAEARIGDEGIARPYQTPNSAYRRHRAGIDARMYIIEILAPIESNWHC